MVLSVFEAVGNLGNCQRGGCRVTGNAFRAGDQCASPYFFEESDLTLEKKIVEAMIMVFTNLVFNYSHVWCSMDPPAH
jgi:hypothetical protein